ncbi:MAG: hypothetical protein HQL54_13360 [Magnetococcales bacterium]|nr:hypothetical protein [Magnetococcales bacterium]
MTTTMMSEPTLKTVRHTLEIIHPDATPDDPFIAANYETTTPIPIQVGSILNPISWPHLRPNMTTDDLFEVTRIEEMLWESEGVVKHKATAYTKSIPANDHD